MEIEVKNLLHSLQLPDFLASLLELYGIRSLEDLSKLDENIIKDVEASVREGRYEGIVDFTQTSNKLQYLGFDYQNINGFRFRPFDFKKILQIPEKATNRIQEICIDMNSILMKRKKKKEIKNPLVEVPQAIIKNANTFLKEHNSNCEIRVDDIQILPNDALQSIYLKCPLCQEELLMSTCKFLWPTIERFKRHFEETHSTKPELDNTKQSCRQASRIAHKITLLFEQKSMKVDFSEDRIKVDYDPETKLAKKAHVLCPLCEKPIIMTMNQFGFPALHNYLRHLKCSHDLIWERNERTSNLKKRDMQCFKESKVLDLIKEIQEFLKKTSKTKIEFSNENIITDDENNNIIQCPFCDAKIPITTKKRMCAIRPFKTHYKEEHEMISSSKSKKIDKTMKLKCDREVEKINEYLKTQSIKNRISSSDARFFFNTDFSKIIRLKVKCPLCEKSIVIGVNKQSCVIISNLKKHIKSNHQVPEEKIPVQQEKESQESEESEEEDLVSKLMEVKVILLKYPLNGEKLFDELDLSKTSQDDSSDNDDNGDDLLNEISMDYDSPSPLQDINIKQEIESNLSSPEEASSERLPPKKRKIIQEAETKGIEKSQKSKTEEDERIKNAPIPETTIKMIIIKKLSEIFRLNEVEFDEKSQRIKVINDEITKSPIGMMTFCHLCNTKLRIYLNRDGYPIFTTFLRHLKNNHQLNIASKEKQPRNEKSFKLMILEKLTQLFNSKSIKFYKNEEDIQLIYSDEKTHPTKATISCQLCDEVKRISMNHKGFPIFTNYINHLDLMHDFNLGAKERIQSKRFQKKQSRLPNKVPKISKKLSEKSKNNTDEYQCEICNNWYFSKRNYNIHLKRHKNANIFFECDYCGTLFKDKNTIKNHIRVKHFFLRPFSCKICNKSYTQQGPLTRHNRNVHFLTNVLEDLEEQESINADLDPLNFTTIKQEINSFDDYFEDAQQN